MSMAKFPQQIYATRNNFNDYGADDMRHGDISEMRLKREFHLTTISNVVNPYTLTRLTAFNNPQNRFFGVYGKSNTGQISVQQCAKLLFDEMQVTSLPFSVYGPYRQLINQMLKHMQESNGSPFWSALLNMAYRHQIMSDNSRNSSRLAVKAVLDAYIDYQKQGIPQSKVRAFYDAVNDTVLPKFDSLIMDKINGLGITVHDVYATRIDLLSLDVIGTRWRARVKFMGQDHFGLDVSDIRKKKFSQFQFFRIWFILQRFNRFGFRPFLTNMEAVIDIEGGR
ncbi:DUF3289 family protein [Serratia rubidaea]|uniref:Protein of uncharacterized function (DUF3289) n=1 Tax=Serratia rubidaea TaxID=61652 RepID=A0A3S5ATQ6_SERRU|nr:DUF3289 family protein [Serratia rubidaea]MDC6119143.1 DUF3289 family protein [Serratia rubidaea]MEB7584973.1 DUF3289 family protein [Serratia rubidaea]VEI70385.1 Protein of uncharacterised function (DUF3289) [Serratia rubidaea]